MAKVQLFDNFVRFHVRVAQYKALNGQGPKYISNLLLCCEPPRSLWSSGTSLLSVHRVKTKHEEPVFSFYASFGTNCQKTAGLLPHSALLKYNWRLFCLPLPFIKSNLRINVLECTATFILLFCLSSSVIDSFNFLFCPFWQKPHPGGHNNFKQEASLNRPNCGSLLFIVLFVV